MHSVCLSVPELSSAEYIKIALNSKQKFEKFVVRFTFSTKHKIWSFLVVVLQWTAKKCTKMNNARADPLYFSLNLLLSLPSWFA